MAGRVFGSLFVRAIQEKPRMARCSRFSTASRRPRFDLVFSPSADPVISPPGPATKQRSSDCRPSISYAVFGLKKKKNKAQLKSHVHLVCRLKLQKKKHLSYMQKAHISDSVLHTS